MIKTPQKPAPIAIQRRRPTGSRSKGTDSAVMMMGAAKAIATASTSFIFDSAQKKLYWAKELRFDGSPETTLNYNLRILGREGVLVLNAVAEVSQLSEVAIGAIFTQER